MKGTLKHTKCIQKAPLGEQKEERRTKNTSLLSLHRSKPITVKKLSAMYAITHSKKVLMIANLIAWSKCSTTPIPFFL